MGRLRRPGPPGTARVRTLAVVAAAGVLVALWIVRQGSQPVVAGFRAPDFAVTDQRGETVTLAAFAGKVVLLNVWATWCGPCREEMPSMERLYGQFSRDDFEIAAISIDALPDRTDEQGNPGGDPSPSRANSTSPSPSSSTRPAGSPAPTAPRRCPNHS